MCTLSERVKSDNRSVVGVSSGTSVKHFTGKFDFNSLISRG